MTYTVYIFSSEDGSVIYVGSSGDPLHRISRHSKKIWWPLVRSAKFEHLPTRDAAYEREGYLIETLKPFANKIKSGAPRVGPPRWQSGVAINPSRVADLMRKKGLNQKQTALAAGIARPYLSQLVNRRRTCSPRTLHALAAVFEVEPEFLIESPELTCNS